jgi:prepilin-type N-terminal cleavage/methylation domain-containing protein
MSESKIARALHGQFGFTLIELVLVIAILGILAVAALPSLFNISLTSAKNNAMGATAAAVQTGLSLYAANQVALGNSVTYPSTLDSATNAAASGTNLMFTNVLQNGIATQWIKKSSTCYIYDFNGTGVAGTGDTYYQFCTAAATPAAICTAAGQFLQTTSANCT